MCFRKMFMGFLILGLLVVFDTSIASARSATDICKAATIKIGKKIQWNKENLEDVF